MIFEINTLIYQSSMPNLQHLAVCLHTGSKNGHIDPSQGTKLWIKAAIFPQGFLALEQTSLKSIHMIRRHVGSECDSNLLDVGIHSHSTAQNRAYGFFTCLEFFNQTFAPPLHENTDAPGIPAGGRAKAVGRYRRMMPAI